MKQSKNMPSVANKFKTFLFLMCMLTSVCTFSKNIVFYSKNIKVSATGLQVPDGAALSDPGPAIFNIKDSFIYYKMINEPEVHVYAISGIDTSMDQTIYTAQHKDEPIRLTYMPKKAKFSIEFTGKGIIMEGDFANTPQDYAKYIRQVKPAGVNTDSLYHDLRISTNPDDPGSN